MAVVASVFKVGWCLMSSSTALPKLDAVSPVAKPNIYHLLMQVWLVEMWVTQHKQSNLPNGSELRRRRMAGR